MGDTTLTLRPFYTGWETYQGMLTQALAPLTAEQLALRAAPSLWPIRTLAAHVVAARVYWFHRVLGEGDPAIAPMQAWDDDGMPQRSAAELVEGLETTWRLVADCLDRWTPADLDVTALTRRGNTVTRGWVIWHIVEHDLHHGGEIGLTLGMHGLPAPDL
jgi:uncharacterized damage-inducible protein DinB